MDVIAVCVPYQLVFFIHSNANNNKGKVTAKQKINIFFRAFQFNMIHNEDISLDVNKANNVKPVITSKSYGISFAQTSRIE